MKKIFVFLIAILSISCSEKEYSIDDIINNIHDTYKKHYSIKYKIKYRQKFFSGDDTSSVIATTRLIRDTTDTIFGGKIFFETQTRGIKYYNLDKILVINDKEKLITEFDPHKGEYYAITGNISGDVIDIYFFQPEKLLEWINDTTSNFEISNEIINNKSFWKITKHYPDDARYSEGQKSIWINKSNFYIDKIVFSIKFQGNYQYNEWLISDIDYNSSDIGNIEKKISEYVSEYDYIIYKDNQAQNEKELLKVGQKAPKFNYIELNKNDSLSFLDNIGKATIIDFWYLSCYPCIKAIPYLEELYDKYKDKGLVIYGINSKDTKEKDIKRFNKFLEFNKISYTICLTNSQTDEIYGVYSYPTLFLIDKNGIIKDVHRGINIEIFETLEQKIINMLE